MLRFFFACFASPKYTAYHHMYIISSYKNGAHTEPTKKFFGFWDDEKLAIFLLDNFFILFLLFLWLVVSSSVSRVFCVCSLNFIIIIFLYFGRFHRKIYLHLQNLNLSYDTHTHVSPWRDPFVVLENSFFLFLHIYFIIFKTFDILHKIN